MDIPSIRWLLILLSIAFVLVAMTNLEERLTFLFIGGAFLILYIMWHYAVVVCVNRSGLCRNGWMRYKELLNGNKDRHPVLYFFLSCAD